MSFDNPLEYDECVALAEYLERLFHGKKILEYAHIINELKIDRKRGYVESMAHIRARKAEGWRPGVPDYIIVTKTDILFIEMKRRKGGRVNENQKRWIDAIATAGGNIFVCNGFDEAQKVIDSFIKKRK